MADNPIERTMAGLDDSLLAAYSQQLFGERITVAEAKERRLAHQARLAARTPEQVEIDDLKAEVDRLKDIINHAKEALDGHWPDY